MVNRENPDFLSASTLKGDKVVNGAGEDIGKIEELMIDLQDGRVGYAVLSFGGFLGMGDKLFAIPWRALQLRVHDHEFLLDVPKETLENAEGFDKDNWPLTTRETLSRTYTYYGYEPYWQSEMAGRTRVRGEAEPEIAATRTERKTSRENPDFLSAGTIKGEKVVNRAGNDVGKIEELMIDLENGRLAYAVVSHGGFLGIGHKLFAIPWQALQLKVHEHKFLLDVPKETLDKEEGFDKDNWPLHRETLSRTYTNYGYEPYWQTAAERPEVSAGKMEEAAVLGGVVRETETREFTRTERERTEIVENDEEVRARQERERLEGLRGEQEEKLSQLEKERMERERQAQAERDRLAQLERERIEVERQTEAERQRLAQLERELQEARRQEETEKVARLESELREVHTQEETRRDRLAQLERECTEARRQAETERERLAQLERERTEVERQADVGRERLSQLERERMEVETRVETREMPDFLSASTIKSDRVVNTAGEDLGRIEELMIDLDNGRVAYAVLSFGGFMGMSDKLFAIPWNSLKCNVHEHAFTLDISKDVLENAEGFDKDNWPLTREGLSRTYTYYGYQPYWQRGTAETTGMPRETESERMTRTERERGSQLKTAEEKMAEQDKERIEKQEESVTDREKREQLERERMIAERRERKYQ